MKTSVWWWTEMIDGTPRSLPEKTFFRNGWEGRQALPLIMPPTFSSRVFLVVHEHADKGVMTMEIVGLEDAEDGA